MMKQKPLESKFGKKSCLALVLMAGTLMSCGTSLDSKKQMSAAQSSRLSTVGTNSNPVATQDSFRILNANCRSDYTEIQWETSSLSKQVNFRIDLVMNGLNTTIPYVQVRCANYQDRCHVFDSNTNQELNHILINYDDQSASVKWDFVDNRQSGDGESNANWDIATAQGYRPQITVQSGYQAGINQTQIPQCTLN